MTLKSAVPGIRDLPVRLSSCVFVGVLAASCSTAFGQPQTNYFGDVDGNGTIDARDALAADLYRRSLVTLPPDWVARIDIDHNSTIDTRDTTQIAIAASMQSGTPQFNLPDGTNTVVTQMNPRFGPVGTWVTIIGDGFRAGLTSVRLNGLPLPIVDLQPSRIIATIPQGASTGFVQVQVQSTTPSLLLDFVVGELPRPSVPPPPVRVGDVIFLDGYWSSMIISGRNVSVFNVPVAVRADPGSLGAVQIQAIVDPNLVQGVTVTPNPTSPLGTTDFNYCIDNQHGDIGLISFTDQVPGPPTGQVSTFVIATIVLRPTRIGAPTTFVMGGISLVVSEVAFPFSSTGSLPHPAFMASKRQRM